MHKVILNRALNQEPRIYGLSYFGTIGAGIIGCLIWMRFGMVIGIIGVAACFQKCTGLLSSTITGSN